MSVGMIVFATAGDPVGAGFVDSLSRPGGLSSCGGRAARPHQ
jgi:hypothetical protein